MKRTSLLPLLTGTVILALTTTLTSCKKETDVKPQDEKTTTVTDAPKVNGGVGNPSAGQDH